MRPQLNSGTLARPGSDLPSKTEPTPPSTALSNPGCYGAPYADCSSKLSGEHFLSKAILVKIAERGKVLSLGGASFSPDEVRRLSVASLAANILCSQHNSGLSPLDAE